MTVLDKIKEATAEYDKAKVALDDTDVGDGSGFAVVVRYGNAHADLCRLMFSALPHLIAVAAAAGPLVTLARRLAGDRCAADCIRTYLPIRSCTCGYEAQNEVLVPAEAALAALTKEVADER